ncbi:MAG: putative molybdenum carrier protein [Verrucomicrobiales bacterium]|nr:putative molybdenum carrier protein [Verrucomicrobiales bacterium]
MLKKIVSGGQTGVDRAALEWALDLGIECGGWCPAGRIAEDGPIDRRFPLIETPSEGYSQRTEWNVRDSDGTVLFSKRPEIAGGTQLTKKFASKWRRPCLVISEIGPLNPATLLNTFIEEHFIETLNVAGPRESTERRMEGFVRKVLDGAFGNQPI